MTLARPPPPPPTFRLHKARVLAQPVELLRIHVWHAIHLVLPALAQSKLAVVLEDTLEGRVALHAYDKAGKGRGGGRLSVQCNA